MEKKYGFTLAEVLITLSVIGVVAAMTIPTLINGINEKTFLVQFQSAYSELSQAYIMAANEHGTADTWADEHEAFDIMKPYLKLIKSDPNSYPIYQVKKLQGTPTTPQYYSMVLANGATLGFEEDGGILINLDTNGLKGPNQWGYDYFSLLLNSKNGSPMITWPYYGGWVETESTWCNKSNLSTAWANGIMCSYWILKRGNMDYLHRNISDDEWSAQ